MIAGIFDGIKSISPKSKLLGFLGGPSGLENGKFKVALGMVITCLILAILHAILNRTSERLAEDAEMLESGVNILCIFFVCRGITEVRHLVGQENRRDVTIYRISLLFLALALIVNIYGFFVESAKIESLIVAVALRIIGYGLYVADLRRDYHAMEQAE